jgi:hypothetical protein
MGSIEEHQKILVEILTEFGTRTDMKIWVNNTGTAYRRGRLLKFGLKGSGDILGILEGGTFLSIEVKSGEARQSKQQKIFQKVVSNLGGLYIVASSIHDVKKALDLWSRANQKT